MMIRTYAFAIALMGILALPALADDTTRPAQRVVINSFVSAGPGTRTAELCGRVLNQVGHHSHIRVLADYNTYNHRTYNTYAGQDGLFCITLVTYNGSAHVSLWEQGSASDSRGVIARLNQ